jgi:hypothetical protein
MEPVLELSKTFIEDRGVSNGKLYPVNVTLSPPFQGTRLGERDSN